MKCKFCGNDLPEESKFCPSCGAPVESEENTSQPENSEESGQAEEAKTENHPYEYGVPEAGTPNQGSQNENPYEYGNSQYGDAGQNNGNPYEYGNTAQNNGNPYEYGNAGQNNENPYQYGNAGYNAGQNPYTDYNANNNSYNQPQKPINGTMYLVFAILSMLLCCLPLGIVAIVYASRVNSMQRNGDYAGAQNAAKKAKMFTIISVVAALVVTIFYLIFAVVLGLADGDYSDDSASNIVENVIEDKNDTANADDNSKTEDSSKEEKKAEAAQPAEASSELGTNWDSYTVQINDKVLTFPCTKADVEAAGLSMDTDYTPENYVVNAKDYELIYFQDDNNNEIMAYAVNNTDATAEVKDCLIGGISVDDYDLENGGLTVIFPGGIQMGATKDSVINAYGDANDAYDGDSMLMYSWYSDDSYNKSCDINFDADTGLACSMAMQNFGE